MPRGWSADHPLVIMLKGILCARRVCAYGLWLFLVAALVSGCTSTRPVVKVGLIAPFEGLYRESGYAALGAMRAAFTECAPPGVNVVPVALDDSADPAKALRAAQKLLVDPAVVAIVGPMTPATTAAVQPVLGAQARPWVAPPAVDPAGGFAAPTSSAWLRELLATAHLDQPSGRIIIAGLPATLASNWVGDGSTIRMEASAELAALEEILTPRDGVLWMGDAAHGAAWLNAQRAGGLAPAFWLGNLVGGDVFAAHLAPQTAADAPVRPPVHWLVWGPSHYNQQLATNAPALPIAELTFAATCTALDEIGETIGVTQPPSPSSSFTWQVQRRDFGAATDPAP